MERLTVSKLKEMLSRRLVIRASNSHTIDALQIVILTQIKHRNAGILVVLKYNVSRSHSKSDPIIIDVELYGAADQDEYLAVLLRKWEDYYGGWESRCVTWTESREVIIEGNLPTGQLFDIPSNNVFFLQEMARIEMWLDIAKKHPDNPKCLSEALKLLYKRVATFIQEQNELISDIGVLIPIRKKS